MMINRSSTMLTAAAVAALGLVVIAPTAAADTGGSATAKAAYGSAATISPSVPSGSGLLGSTLASTVQPIVDALTYQINNVTSSSVRGLLNSSGNTADTTTGPASYPTGPLAKVAVPGLLSVDLNGPAGSVSATSSAYAAQSSFSSAGLRAFNIDAADATAASASVNCPTTGNGSPSASVSLSDIQLVNGYVKARLRNGTYEASVDGGTSWASVRDIHLTTVPGHADLKIVGDGDLLEVQETIGVDRLLAGLGLGGLFSGLPGQIDTTSSNLTLTMTVGPGSSTAQGANGMAAWGLGVGVDVAGTIVVKQLSNLGVLGGSATITVPSGIGSGHYGNVMDLKLAYATCTGGAAPSPVTRIPAGLI